LPSSMSLPFVDLKGVGLQVTGFGSDFFIYDAGPRTQGRVRPAGACQESRAESAVNAVRAFAQELLALVALTAHPDEAETQSSMIEEDGDRDLRALPVNRTRDKLRIRLTEHPPRHVG
jgi:hypothetical protein